jgi:hypothetical protein
LYLMQCTNDKYSENNLHHTLFYDQFDSFHTTNNHTYPNGCTLQRRSALVLSDVVVKMSMTGIHYTEQPPTSPCIPRTTGANYFPSYRRSFEVILVFTRPTVTPIRTVVPYREEVPYFFTLGLPRRIAYKMENN